MNPDDLRQAIDQEIGASIARLRTQVAHLGIAAQPLVDTLLRAVAGGKRIRAALTYWSWQVHGGTPNQQQAVIGLGAAHELFQTAALIHDDLMDNSDMRRGQPASHRQLENWYATQHQFTADAHTFGQAAALVLGDLALVLCDEQVDHSLSGQPEAPAHRVRAIFNQMRAEVFIGQYLDLHAQHHRWGDNPVADEQRAREVIRAKTARYSAEHPLVIGALLAGAHPEQIAVCQQIGLPLGEAFQLRDDLLGVYGDPAQTGKPAGDDLREGKRTVLVARALHLARKNNHPQTAKLIQTQLGRPDLNDAQIDQLREAISNTGAVSEMELLIEQLAHTAFEVMAAQSWAEPGATRLLELAHAAVHRHA